ncbi:MAG: hypothetical protein R6U87_01090 [Thiohalospira sp.]
MVAVHVIDVDLRRQRIALSMRGPETAGEEGGATARSDRPEGAKGAAGKGGRDGGKDRRPESAKKPAKEKEPQTAMAAAFAALKDT